MTDAQQHNDGTPNAPRDANAAPRRPEDPTPSEISVMDPLRARQILGDLSPDQQAALFARARSHERLALADRSPRPRQLVRSLPADDLAVTIQELGLLESVLLLAGAELEQVEFVGDIFLWEGRNIVPENAAVWLRALASCGTARVLEWFRNAEPELTVAVLKPCFVVETIDEDLQPPAWESDLPSFTLDGTYFVGASEPELLAVGRRILTILRGEEPELYRSLLEGVIWDTTAESEWEAGEFRERRMATFGFPGLDEAIEIYRVIPPDVRRDHVEETSRGPMDDRPMPVLARREPLPLANGDLFVAHCLPQAGDVAWQKIFFGEISAVANHIQVADKLPLCRPESRRLSLGKTLGAVNIGLECLAGGDREEGARLLRESYVRALFQVGYSRIDDVAGRARRLIRQGWLNLMPGRTALLDPPWRETIDGLCRARPVCYEVEASPAPLFREFRDMRDIEHAEKTVALVEATGVLLVERLGLNAELVGRLVDADAEREPARGSGPQTVTLSSIFLTALAHRLIDEPFATVPLTPGEAASAVAMLRSGDPTRNAGRGLDRSWLNRWLEEIEVLCGDVESRTRAAIREFVTFCWNRLEEELGRLRPGQEPDPRFVTALIVESERPA